MESKTGLEIVGMGGSTSIGTCLPSIRAAVGSEINCFASSDYLRRRQNGKSMILATMELLDPFAPVEERIKSLTRQSVQATLLPWSDIAQKTGMQEYRFPVFLSVPSIKPGFDANAQIRLCRDIIDALPIQVDKSKCTMLNTGHESAITTLLYADDLMNKKSLPACLIGGVESYINIETLNWLDAQGRLKGDEHKEGIIPGEASGFLLLCRKDFVRKHRLDTYAEIVGIARTCEPAPWYVNKPTTGQGLTKALQEIFNNPKLRTKKAEVTYCDMNGESWRADEWSYAYLRTVRHHGEPLDLRHPADCWGDIGAASGTMLIILAVYDLFCEQTNNQRALIWTASDTSPFRSACIVET